jgi:hypothetical protein
MKNEMTENLAGPAFNRAGAAGRDNIPALIGRSLTGETSQGSCKGLLRVVQGSTPLSADQAGLLAKGGC